VTAGFESNRAISSGGSAPSLSAAISTASWTTLSPGSATPLPTLNDSRTAIVAGPLIARVNAAFWRAKIGFTAW
jgi:hypothetical protein